MASENVLVIGGNGFIGEHLVAEIGKSGGAASVFGRRSEGTIEEAVAKASAVAYLASPDEALLRRVLAAISERRLTLLYASTLLLYRGGAAPQKEGDPLLPMTEYARKKLLEEEIISEFGAGHPGIRVIVARLGNVYGDRKNKGLIGRIFEKLYGEGGGENIVVAGDGTQVRDFVFVDDAARALSELIGHGEEGIVNVVTGVGTDVLRLIGTIEKVTARKIEYSFGAAVPETHSLVGDNSRLRRLIGWAPDTSLEDGLRKTLSRYMMNPQ